MANGQSDQLNLTVVALVALVAIVGLVALVMNAASIKDVQLSSGSTMAQAQSDSTNVVGDIRKKIVIKNTEDSGENLAGDVKKMRAVDY